MISIDDKTYPIKEVNRYKNQTPKTQIVLASSLRKDHNHILRLQRRDYGNTKTWNTYTISREGIVYQHYDPMYHTDFLGIKDSDKQNITIVLENMGSLYKTPSGKYVNWINEICENDRVITKKWLGYTYWEKYDDIQIENAVKLCALLHERFGIPKKLIDFRQYHKDATAFKGIIFKSNFFEECSDNNPLIDIENFTELLSK